MGILGIVCGGGGGGVFPSRKRDEYPTFSLHVFVVLFCLEALCAFINIFFFYVFCCRGSVVDFKSFKIFERFFFILISHEEKNEDKRSF